MRYLFSLLIIVSIVSCSDMDRGKQLRKIQTIDNTLDSIQTVLIDNSDLEEIQFIQGCKKDLSSRILSSQDTISFELAIMLDVYNNAMNNINPLIIQRSVLDSNIIKQKEDLLSLKLDIENGSGKRNEYDEYINFESNKTQQLRNQLITFIEMRNTLFEVQAEYYQKIENQFNKVQ